MTINDITTFDEATIQMIHSGDNDNNRKSWKCCLCLFSPSHIIADSMEAASMNMATMNKTLSNQLKNLTEHEYTYSANDFITIIIQQTCSMSA
jgi:hypothetical protein